jgi:hypothetical protein
MVIPGRFRAHAAVVLLLTLVSATTAKYSGGSGTAQAPYQISTAADLIALGETPADYDKHFLLTADIDLDPKLPGRKVFDKAVIEPETCFAQGCTHRMSLIVVDIPCVWRILGLTRKCASCQQVR